MSTSPLSAGDLFSLDLCRSFVCPYFSVRSYVPCPSKGQKSLLSWCLPVSSSPFNLFTSSSAGFLEPWGERFDQDIPFRVEWYKALPPFSAHCPGIDVCMHILNRKGQHRFYIFIFMLYEYNFVGLLMLVHISTSITGPPCALYCFLFLPNI